MKQHPMLACASAILLFATTVATVGQAELTAQQPRKRMVAPIRGEAELGFTKPVVKRTKGEIVTTIRVQNLSETNTIVGLKVDEYWYDKAGDPVTGDQYRHRRPLMPQEVIEVVLHTPVNPKMDRNQYMFEHAHGAIKTVAVPKLELPPAEEE
jgi:hypothetical protein